MDPSSDPGRDEYGLPPVDIEIPDDARDLDRDVQAYHRELRAQRRRMRLRRIAAPLVRHGMVIPLVAGCLALTLLCGTLLTVLAGHQVTPAPAAPTNAARRSSPSASPGPGPLPDVQVVVDGKQVRLRTLVPAVLAWVPNACGCATALRQLARQAARAHLSIYIVSNAMAVRELTELATQAGQRDSHVVYDTTNALGIAYGPVGLTAILARGDGSVGDVVRQLPMRDQQVVDGLRSFASPSASPATPANTPVPQSS